MSSRTERQRIAKAKYSRSPKGRARNLRYYHSKGWLTRINRVTDRLVSEAKEYLRW